MTTTLEKNVSRKNAPNTAVLGARNAILIAMAAPDDWALRLIYKDKGGCLTERFVSPIRLVGADRFLALCLCREEPRQFCMAQCENITLVPASHLTMPMPIQQLN